MTLFFGVGCHARSSFNRLAKKRTCIVCCFHYPQQPAATASHNTATHNNTQQSTAPMYDEYVWLVVCGAFMCFTMAWGIGANDVANSFGTTVGAKTISLKQACLIAAVFEFAGAMTFGRVVTKTISGEIASLDAFAKDPDIFMYGMLSALTASTIWLYYATYMEWPVSTTHSIIG